MVGIVFGKLWFITIYQTQIAATLTHVFSITKPTLIFCDGHEYDKVHKATVGWHPEILTLTEHVEGVQGIETLLDPTTTERMYQ